jgi:hypothetical protein
MSATVRREGIVEALSARLRPDIRPAGTGACTCPPGTVYAGCECGWGTAITRMLQLGYSRQADPVTIAREVSDLGKMISNDLMPAARRTALRTLARTWTDSLGALAKLLGVTPAAIRKAAPDATARITGRTGAVH